ncbi:MAG: sigma-70 family RNA polymerase sigma factor [Bacteroidia bacterium]
MGEIIISKELTDACIRKLPDAQEAVYKLVYSEFMKICLRYTGDYDEAANVLQEAFIKIFMRSEAYSGKGSFVGWMKRIVVNSAIDQIRKRSKLVEVPIDEQEWSVSEDIPEHEYIVDQPLLLKTIRELPEMQLLVFNLFVMDNCSHQEIAVKLSISVASSKWHLFEARRILKNKLSVYIND